MAKRASIFDCELCGTLSDGEYAFSKFGQEGGGTLSGMTASLVPVESLDSLRAERHHVKRCTKCGTFYRYDTSYEYLVNGSEEEEELVRLAPIEAKDRMSPEEYLRVMREYEERADEAGPKLRFHVVKSLAMHYLAEGDSDAMKRLMGRHPDLTPRIMGCLKEWRGRSSDPLLAQLIREAKGERGLLAGDGG